MKVLVVLLAIIGLSVGAPKHHPRLAHHKISPRSLIDDLQDFIDLLPLDDIKAIADEHLQTDGAFAAVVLYLQGPEWTELVDTVGAKPAVQDFIQYLNDAGLPVDDILAWIDNLITGATPGADPDEEGSLRPLLDEIEAILPLADLLALLNDKLQNSPDFQALYTKVSSEEAHTLVEEVRAIDEVQRLAQRLIDMGVKVEEALAYVYEFLGWGEPKLSKSGRTLADDLQEFIDLLPLDEIKAIADEHLQTDGAFAAVVLYLQGPEWTELVETVGAMPAVQDFIQFLNDAGLPVDDILAWIDNLIAGATPGADPDEEGSLRPLLDEIEAILPLADLLALLNDKLQNSPDFQALYTKVSSEEAHTLVEEVRAIDEVQRLAQRLIDMGVKVEEALAVVYEFLGWGEPKLSKSGRTLADDLQEFIDLLPLDDIQAIADEHLQTDGAFAAVVLYLQGPEWTELVDTVGAMPAVQDFIQFLNDAGLPVDDILAWIDNLIAGATPGADPDEEGSLRPLLDEIEAILPLADLLALLNDKLQNSPDFQALYVEVSSEEAHTLVEEVRALDEVQTLAQRLISMGVKVEEALAVVYEFLGWGEPKKF
jgi:DNA-directed RNA polymerase subunit F